MLALNDNRLGPDVPESLGGMTSLLALDLCDNKLMVLPSSLGDLPRIKHLWLARNVLESLPDSLAQLRWGCSALTQWGLHKACMMP